MKTKNIVLTFITVLILFCVLYCKTTDSNKELLLCSIIVSAENKIRFENWTDKKWYNNINRLFLSMNEHFDNYDKEVKDENIPFLQVYEGSTMYSKLLIYKEKYIVGRLFTLLNNPIIVYETVFFNTTVEENETNAAYRLSIKWLPKKE